MLLPWKNVFKTLYKIVAKFILGNLSYRLFLKINLERPGRTFLSPQTKEALHHLHCRYT